MFPIAFIIFHYFSTFFSSFPHVSTDLQTIRPQYPRCPTLVAREARAFPGTLWLSATPCELEQPLFFSGDHWGKNMFKTIGFWGAQSPYNYRLRLAHGKLLDNHLHTWVAILNQRVPGHSFFISSHHVATKNEQKIPWTEMQAGVRIGVQEGEQAHAVMRFKAC